MPQSPLAFVAKIFGTSNFGVGIVDKQSALWGASRHAGDYAAAYAGVIGIGASQAGATTSAALATTYTGLCLSNPAGSGKNLSVLSVSGVLNVVPAALTMIGLITGFAAGGITVHTTPVTPQNGFLNGPALVGLVDAACTLVGTPVWSGPISETPTATTVPVAFFQDIDGDILIPPGGYIAIGTSIAGPAAGLWGAFRWEENPI